MPSEVGKKKIQQGKNSRFWAISDLEKVGQMAKCQFGDKQSRNCHSVIRHLMPLIPKRTVT